MTLFHIHWSGPWTLTHEQAEARRLAWQRLGYRITDGPGWHR